MAEIPTDCADRKEQIKKDLLKHIDKRSARQSFDLLLCMDCFRSKDDYDLTLNVISEWANEQDFSFTVRPNFHVVCHQDENGDMQFCDNKKLNKMHIIFIDRAPFPKFDITFPMFNQSETK